MDGSALAGHGGAVASWRGGLGLGVAVRPVAVSLGHEGEKGDAGARPRLCIGDARDDLAYLCMHACMNVCTYVRLSFRPA